MFRKWKKGTHPDPQRDKLKTELYSFKKTVEHGFPHHPSALAYDPILNLMAIGTKSGAIKVYGAPGVEFTGMHPDVNQVLQLHFMHGLGQLVSILDDNTMHLWELKNIKNDKSGAQSLVNIGASQLSGRPGQNQITVVTVCSDNSAMWVGAEGGGIYLLSLPDLEPLESGNIHQDQVMQSVPDNYKTGKALGPVEAIVEHPGNPALILIGYNRGLVALWNTAIKNAESYYLSDKSLESLAWHSNCKEFVSTHHDGYLCNWRVESSAPHTSYAPYGPFPCKAITKVLWKSSRSKNAGAFLMYSGGMPRANYGDRHCVSVVHGGKHVAFDVTSRIIDFFAICRNPNNHEWEEPEFLVILAEEELVTIDLVHEDWPTLTAPYLASPHASAITCSVHVDDVAQPLYENMLAAARSSKLSSKSAASWPITGGENLAKPPPSSTRNLLLTGHEDGSVKIWEVTGVAMSPVLKMQTSSAFVTDADADRDDELEEQFPPFRKVGEFDPYSDDLRLAVRKVAMCPSTGTIVAGGTAGQVVVLVLATDAIETVVTSSQVDVLEGRTDFTWKGHEKLDIKTNHIDMEPGYQISSVVQCQPPASITSLCVQANWGLIGLGTGHGFALFDYLQNAVVVLRCTLEAGDHLAMEGNFSRVKSFKQSLRQSMRRIRTSFRGRGEGGSRRRASGKRRFNKGGMSQKLQEANAALVDEEETASVGGWSPHTTGHRRIEARSSDDGMTGMVRCTYFATTFIRDTTSSSPSFWAGTNSGGVYVFALHVPDYNQRHSHHVTSVTGKLVQLKHRAPIVDIAVVDGAGIPQDLRQGSGVTSNGGPPHHNTNPNHSLLISSEEQLKVFALPKIAAKRKFKLTALDGSLLRKVVYARFQSSTNPDYHEYSMACLTNLGEVHVFGQLPALRPQVTYPCMSRDDPHAISSAVFANDGQGLYLLSPSEYERFTISTVACVESRCRVAGVMTSPDNDVITTMTPEVVEEEEVVPAHAQIELTVVDVSSSPASLDKKRSPSRKRSDGAAVIVAMHPSSPKTPLLCDHDDDDDDDDEEDLDHVSRHESVLEEAQRTLAEVDLAGGDGPRDVDDVGDDVTGSDRDVDVDVEELLGAVAEAERVLNNNAAADQ